MKTFWIGLIVGAVFGVSAMWLALFNNDDLALDTDASILDKIEHESKAIPLSSSSEGQGDAGFHSIAEIMELKSDFEQTEALYVLAGRSDVRSLASLIKQADSIVDASDRNAALGILFSKLTDLNPLLAVEASQDTRFIANDNISHSIWRSWAREDLDAALKEVVALMPYDRKKDAVQAMYQAVGVFGNSKTEKIKRLTGIEPSQWALADSIERVAKQSLYEAINLVNKLSSPSDQKYVARRVAVVAAKSDPDNALHYTRSFNSVEARGRYRSSVLAVLGASSPQDALDQWVAGGYQKGDFQRTRSAFRQLALEDFELAQSYVDEAPQSASKQTLISVLLAVKSSESASEALSLAEIYEGQGNKEVVRKFVGKMVGADPAAALQLLQGKPDIKNHKYYVAAALAGVAKQDIATALASVAGISDPGLKSLADLALLSAWSDFDVNSALDYALSLDDFALSSGDARLYHVSLDGADFDLGMRFIERYSKLNIGTYSSDFARGLLERYKSDELVALMQQYKGSEALEIIKPQVLRRVFESPNSNIERFIDTFWSADEKVAPYARYAQSLVSENPFKAFNLMNNLQGSENKIDFLSSVLPYHRDIKAVKSWVGRLSDETVKDAAIVTLSHRLSADSNSDMRLVDSIQDQSLKEDAIVNVLMRDLKAPGLLARARDLGISESKIENLQKIQKCVDGTYNSIQRRRHCASAGLHYD